MSSSEATAESDGTVYALLVGINAYLAPISALYGCVNDVGAIEDVLRARLGERLVVHKLLDAEASRDNVINAFSSHLGQAGPRDTALFVYAGHGTEEPASPKYVPLESTNRIQTLLLHDCGRRVNGKLRRALADKELAVLLADVADNAGHVAVILDCCSSGGGTRDPFVRLRGWSPDPSTRSVGDRDLAALATARADDEFLPGSLDRPASSQPTHVALAACASSQKAKESGDGSVARGAFTVAVCETLAVLGDHATYRSILSSVASRVARSVDDQTPELYPVERGGLGDQPFLGGVLAPVVSRFVVSRTRTGWSVDAGTIHGVTAPTANGAVLMTCRGPDGSDVGNVRVVEVTATSSTVEPVGWTPDERLAYDAEIATVPLPEAVVVPDADIEVAIADAIRERIASTGPNGEPSPFVRWSQHPDDSGVLLRVRNAGDGRVRIARVDGSAYVHEVPATKSGGSDDIDDVVSKLEHIARWEIVRRLGGHSSPLDGAVVLDVRLAEDGETTVPTDREPLPAAPTQHLSYRRTGAGDWSPPTLFLSLRNTTDEDVWVAVLALNDRFGCSTVTAPCRLAARHPGLSVIEGGGPIPITLPPGRDVVPGAMVRDWLTIITCDVQFDASSFDLPTIDQSPPDRSASTRSWGSVEPVATATVRGEDATSPVPRWVASTIELSTTVPGG